MPKIVINGDGDSYRTLSKLSEVIELLQRADKLGCLVTIDQKSLRFLVHLLGDAQIVPDSSIKERPPI